MQNESVFIIAEAGVNHDGNIETAKKLIDAAKYAGADAVKFQSFTAKAIVVSNAQKAEYQTKNTGNDESQFDMLKRLELSYDDHRTLMDYCKKTGIRFLSSPFDLDSIMLLNKLGLDIFKIPSGEITNYPYLEAIGRLNKAVILSTGMAYLHEVKDAYELLINAGTEKSKISLLHANTEYPSPFSDVNLLAMQSLKHAFNVNVGYSDHTIGITVPIAAVAMGANIIEKHFTLEKNASGPDHKASLNPEELKQMVIAIRQTEAALGSAVKKPSASEITNLPIVRKSIVAKKTIREGELFTEDNITTKRPATGINPMQWKQIIGKKAKRDYKTDDFIKND
ncbi:MAG: N-acetylneuraminate synthase [Salinivirgaceae bacterium]|jgi:N,N'-diacetyllegionaminate synthase|nr:N-acetylneuraminate synthase [Salinivirgaceae bacterium]